MGTSYTVGTDRPRILFVDDYPDALAVWSTFLELCGYDVVATDNGLKAVELAHEFHPNLVILDLDLPGLSGCGVARELRQQEDTATVPLIAITGHSELPMLADARLAGFDVILTKPCEPESLINTIKSLLEFPTIQPSVGH